MQEVIPRPETPPDLPPFVPGPFSERESSVLERYRTTPKEALTKVKLAGRSDAPAVHSWAALDALDELFQRRYWIETQELIRGSDVVVKLTFKALLDNGGVLVRVAYGGQGNADAKSFVVGGCRLADTLKTAQVDALKKLCGMLGMFQDVYRRYEQEQDRYDQRPARSRAAPAHRRNDGGARSGTTADTPEKAAMRKLQAVAGERWPERPATAMKAFLGIADEPGSTKALADHMVLPRSECQEERCPRPHGVTDRAEAYRVMTRWIEEPPAAAEGEP